MLRVWCVAETMIRRENGLLGVSPFDSPSKTVLETDLGVRFGAPSIFVGSRDQG